MSGMIREAVQTLTVGQVSGLIALGTAVVSLTTPLLIAIFLLQYYNRETTAATWSVVARELHRSAWPSFFLSDSVAIRNVDKHVSIVRYMGVLLALLTVIAGIVTPLGLRETSAVVREGDAQFQYIRDQSPYGRSTQARPDTPLSRDCGIQFQFCPGAIVPGAVNDQGINATANSEISATTDIPSNITEIFTSASRRSTIASIFDIQYRSWKNTVSPFYNRNQSFPAGAYRPVDILIAREDVVLVEGAVVDINNGGIGYRNHTIPVEIESATWDEDLLWIAPDYACVNTNLSLEFTLGQGNYSRQGIVEADLVDNGGFARLSHRNPYATWPNVTDYFTDPDPWTRANYTAWTLNALTSIALNLSDTVQFRYGLNVSEGGRWPVIIGETTNQDYFYPIGVKSSFPIALMEDLLGLPQYVDINNDGSLVSGNETLPGPPSDHPYEFAARLLKELTGRCSGQDNDYRLNNDTTLSCGYVLSPPARLDGVSSLQQEVGSRWTTNLHTCAGAVKASIKTVTFTTNSSSSLEDMRVTSIRDKQYPDASSQPLWAYEDWNRNGSEGAFGNALWGLVDNSFESTPSYNFTRSPHFYIPGRRLTTLWNRETTQPDILAGVRELWSAMSLVLTSVFGTFSSTPKYGGLDSIVLQQKWEDLSKEEGGITKLLGLVWTDIVASMTVGTNTRGPQQSASLSKRDDAPASSSNTQVKFYGRRLTYQLRYAVPAIILLALWILLIVLALVIVVIHRSAPAHMRALLNNTSLGRVAAMLDRFPRDQDAQQARSRADAKSGEWNAAVGAMKFKVGGSGGMSGVGSGNGSENGSGGKVSGGGGAAYERVPMQGETEYKGAQASVSGGYQGQGWSAQQHDGQQGYVGQGGAPGYYER